ncbi:MAG: tyrosine-type recombinase/integrase [Hyphomicrobiaceae bacterium]
MGDDMIQVRFPFVVEDVDRHGNVRYYFRRKGFPKVRIRALPGTQEFSEAYHRLSDQSEAGTLPQPDDDTVRPGTFRWLCVQYFSSSDFARLDPRTQRVRRSILEHMLAEPAVPGEEEIFANFPIHRMSGKAIRVLRDRKKDLPGAADNRVQAAKHLFKWAMRHELVTSNPARDVEYVAPATDGHKVWTEADMAKFEQKHPVGTRARLALALLLYTGARRSDVVLLGRQHISDGNLKFTARKNHTHKPMVIDIPVVDELAHILANSPTGDLTFLVTEYGRPFTGDGFGNWFRDRCREAGLENRGPHGLRKAAATIAAENGATTHQLMSIFGWSTMQQPEHYTRAAERKRLAKAARTLLTRPKIEQSVPPIPAIGVPPAKKA